LIIIIIIIIIIISYEIFRPVDRDNNELLPLRQPFYEKPASQLRYINIRQSSL
jgi:hypothetical protein